MLHVRPGINPIMDLVVVTSPVADLELVVCIHDRRIEKINLPCRVGGTGVAFPEVAVDEARLYRAAIFGEVIKKGWNDMQEQAVFKLFELGPRAIGLEVQDDDMSEEASEICCPVAFPGYSLRDPALASGDVEAELSCR